MEPWDIKSPLYEDTRRFHVAERVPIGSVGLPLPSCDLRSCLFLICGSCAVISRQLISWRDCTSLKCFVVLLAKLQKAISQAETGAYIAGERTSLLAPVWNDRQASQAEVYEL